MTAPGSASSKSGNSSNSSIVDVCVIGAGTAGIACAQELARHGASVVLLDRLHPMPDCLKAEKLDGVAVLSLLRLGFQETVSSVLTPLRDVEVFFGNRRLGTVPLRPPEAGTLYHGLINALREKLDARVEFRTGEKVVRFEHHDDRIEVLTESGTSISCRLAVLATGDARQLLTRIGATYEPKVPYQAFVVAFDLEGVLADSQGLIDSQTYHHPVDRAPVSFATFFRLGDSLRANIFCPGDTGENWQRDLKQRPLEVLAHGNRLLAAAVRGGSWQRTSPVMIRKVQVAQVDPPSTPRLVVLGDAAHTLDPTGGGGFVFSLLEAELLAGTHVPTWLKQDDFSIASIARFYEDHRRLQATRQFFAKTQYILALNRDESLKGSWRRLRFGLEHIAAARRGGLSVGSRSTDDVSWQLPMAQL